MFDTIYIPQKVFSHKNDEKSVARRTVET